MQDSTREHDTVGTTGNIQIDGLLTGAKWSQDASGGATTITFSFPSKGSQYDGYEAGDAPSSNFQAFSNFQQSYTRELFSNISKYTKLRFEEITGDKAGEATLRFGWTEDKDDNLAYAYEPGEHPAAGDIWFNSLLLDPNMTSLTHDTMGVIIHELGHALGLKHPHDAEGQFKKLPVQFDGPDYTALTYTNSAKFGQDAGDADLIPQTLMWFDIQALQHLYGKNTETTGGEDTYEFDLAARHYLTIWDAGGKDTIKIKNGNANLDLDLTPGTWSDIGTKVTYGSDPDGDQYKKKTLFIAPDTVVENATGASGDDKITGNDAANRILGGDGNDTLTGGKGNDVVRGDKGSDRVSGGEGNDQAFAGPNDAGNDTVDGNTGNDTLAGGAGNDMIVGGDYTDSDSSAKAGSDVLFGGAGNDHLVAGSYNSKSKAVVNSDTSENTLYAGSGNDTLDGDNGNDTLGGGTGNDTINGGAGNDVIYGGKGANTTNDDTINAGDGNDSVFAGSGNDTVGGGDGMDTLFGGNGSDVLNGGAGNDTLWGGAGDDTLTGGSGADTFAFNAGHGDDVITDFDVSQDSLNFSETATDFQSISDVADASQVTSVGGVSGLMIDLGDGNSVFLQNINSASDLSVIF